MCNSRAYGHQPCSCRPCRRATTPSSWLWLTQPDSRTPPRSLSLFSQVQCGADTDIFLCFQQLVRLISFFLFHFVAKNNVFPWKKKPTVVVLLCPGVNFQPQRHLTLMFTQLSPHWLISSSVLQTLCYVLSALFISISNTQDNYLLRHEFPGQTM